jgi:hypothetical protein
MEMSKNKDEIYNIKNHKYKMFERKFNCSSCKKDIKEFYIAEKKKPCKESEICMNCLDPGYKIYS